MEEIVTKDIDRIIDALYDSSGIDFSNYAFSSFKRRIMRFLEINKIRDLNRFIERIIADKSYSDSLIKEITVNVTEMFRDPSFWIALRDSILPKISSSSDIKIWHAACSTGEEVYSMAILLKESDLLQRSKIVATDLNSSVLKVAQEGAYSLRSQEINCKNYDQFAGNGKLTDYYTIIGNTAQFDKRLIDNVDFRCHNLAQDGPIPFFDLILCRNVLIYFNFDLQEKVIQTFSKSMSTGSFIGIGSKESIRWCNTCGSFEVVSYEEKIYRKVVEKEQHYYMNI